MTRSTVDELRVRLRARLLLLVTLATCLLTGAAGAAEPAEPVRFQAERVVAFADVHGAHEQLLQLLRSLEIIDERQGWIAGSTHLVSLGDLLDRGPDSRKTMDLLMRLQVEARAAGGQLHVVLGNHELMNLTGDLRYVAKEEYAAFAGDAAAPAEVAAAGRPAGFTAHRQAFAPDGEYGRWLLNQPPLVLINDTAFVHAGLPPLASTMEPAALAATFRTRLQSLLILRENLENAGVIAPHQDVLDSAAELRRRLDSTATGPAEPVEGAAAVPEAHADDARRFVTLAEDELFSSAGPLWYRGTARCHEMLEAPILEAVLRRWAVARVIVGHTPTPDHRVRQRFDGRAVLADTGMLKTYYRGQPAAVILPAGIDVPNPVRVHYPEANVPDGVPAGVPDPVPVPDIDGLDPADIVQLLREGVIEPVAGGERPDGTLAVTVRSADARSGERTLRAMFQPGGKGEIDNQLAAYALDRHLGLGLVAPVAERTWERRKGVLSAVWHNAIDELQRGERGSGPANWCARGSVFNLMYALDALIGNAGRLPTTMIYEPSSWEFLSIGHGRAFGRDTDFPAYLENAPTVLPPRLADRLRALTEADVERLLGALLSGGERRSLLKRRDQLLANWAVGD